MAYCTKCGKKVPDNADFCPGCGIKLKTTRGKPSSAKKADKISKDIEDRIERGMAEKHEKYEKQEKFEKYEKSEKQEKSGGSDSRFGPFIGGFILVWVSICLYLAYFNHVEWAIFWAYIISGVGVVLILIGLLMYRFREPGVNPGGMLIGGVVLIIIGTVAIFTWESYGSSFWRDVWQGSYWIFIPLVIGIIIIISGLVALRRSPKTR